LSAIGRLHVNYRRWGASASVAGVDPAKLDLNRSTVSALNTGRYEFRVQGVEFVWVAVGPVGKTRDSSNEFEGMLKLLPYVASAGIGW